MVFGGFTLIIFGVFTKLGALLSSIPDPLVGVVLSSSMAMVCGVGIAGCQAADMKKTRNVAIIGFSIMMGFCVPEFHNRNPNSVNTGYLIIKINFKIYSLLMFFFIIFFNKY